MRIFTFPLLAFAVFPATALALTIQPAHLYTDVRTASPEAAGINMLSREGLVQGYQNGFFGVSRQINRAEFLKIAMGAVGGASEGTSGDCFPDVRSQWFAPYVCTANAQDIVAGYSDGFFHPEQTVSYGEALKILDVLFGYEVSPAKGAHWAESYYMAAVAKQTDLPVTIDLDRPLTRGLAARLLAAFLAESKGQLPVLRLAEAGQYLPESSSSSMSSSSSSMSSSSSVSSSSSPVAFAPLFTLPSVSHFLITGQKSDAVADIIVRSTTETAHIASVQVKLANEVLSLDTLELVNALDGTLVAVLTKRTTTDIADYKLTYEAQIALSSQMQIPADKDVRLVLRANIRAIGNNGASEQLLQVRTFSVTLHGDTSFNTFNIPAVAPFPKHQTSFGRIVKVLRTSPASAPMASSVGAVVSAFSFSGSSVADKSLTIESLTFSVTRTGNFTASNWNLRPQGSALSVPCTISQDGLTVSCLNIQSIGGIPSATPLALELRADLALPNGVTNATLQTNLTSAGSPEQLGAVQWTDGSGHFRWIEGNGVIATGTYLQ